MGRLSTTECTYLPTYLKQREEYEATNDELLAALKETSDVLKNSKTTVHDR